MQLLFRASVHWLLVASLSMVLLACGGDDDDAGDDEMPTPSNEATSANGDEGDGDTEVEGDNGDDVDELIDSLDFGDGAAVVDVGGERYELALGGNIEIDGTRYIGVCQSLFGLIAGNGYDPEGSELGIEFEIPPPDWESFEDGRFDGSAPRILIEGVRHPEQPADDPNAGGWRADIDWQNIRDTVPAGASQLDSWELEDDRATGTATFLAVDYFGEPLDGAEPIEGTFDIGCAQE